MGLYEFWDFATKIATIDALKDTSRGNQPTAKQQAVRTAVRCTYIDLDVFLFSVFHPLFSV